MLAMKLPRLRYVQLVQNGRKPSLAFTLALIGVLGGIAAIWLSLSRTDGWGAAVSCAAAVLAIVLTYIIAKNQDRESGQLSGVVNKTKAAVDQIRELQQDIRELQDQSTDLLREIAERDSAADYDPSGGHIETAKDTVDETSNKPQWEQAGIAKLRAQGADLNFGSLQWKRKIPDPPLPGNHGWFVESSDSPNRWFVRKARGITARKAMPRHYLEQLTREQGVRPQSIAHDYQVKQHGLASWFARTYDGRLYRVSRNFRADGQPIRTEVVFEDVT